MLMSSIIVIKIIMPLLLSIMGMIPVLLIFFPVRFVINIRHRTWSVIVIYTCPATMVDYFNLWNVMSTTKIVLVTMNVWSIICVIIVAVETTEITTYMIRQREVIRTSYFKNTTSAIH